MAELGGPQLLGPLLSHVCDVARRTNSVWFFGETESEDGEDTRARDQVTVCVFTTSSGLPTLSRDGTRRGTVHRLYTRGPGPAARTGNK